MRKIAYLLLFIASFILLFKVDPANCDPARAKYEEAAQLVREKQYDFAFLAFRAIIREYPDTKYAGDALFALGEYSYLTKSYSEANKNFNEYITKYTNSIAAIFAKVYLLKIIPYLDKVPERKKEAIDKITADFFSQPLFLLFSESKEIAYLSPFQNKFVIRYYLDKIEVYQNGKIFAQLTP